MTVKEAEKIYEQEKKARCALITEKTDKFKKRCICFAVIMIVVGIVLLIIAGSIPKEHYDYSGIEYTSADAYICYMFGGITLVLGISALVLWLVANSKPVEFQPKDFISETKELYRNYIRCEDLSDEDKEYYKELLQEIRNAELIASNSSIATSVIMASFLHK